jgi:DNA-binding CsgD family transcriptional regulator/sugar lactone lactonase YvrE
MEIALSPREREVAGLVAEGLTNREIAERLVISERTAEGHVEQIRNKLGFHSRSQIASWVTAQSAGISSSARATPAGAIAVELPRPVNVEVPRVPRRVTALVLTVVLVVITAIAFWQRPPSAALVLVAGIGTDGYSGDQGPATSAQLSEITSMGFDRDGALIIADSFFGAGVGSASRTRVRSIDTKGKIRTIAGDGGEFFGATTGVALRLSIHGYLVVGRDGDLYVARSAGRTEDINYVGRIGADGAFTLLLGGWPEGGFAPLGAQLNLPTALALRPDGTLYVVDSRNYVIRSVARDGTVKTVFGTGSLGSAGDGGPPLASSMSQSTGIAFSPDGSLYIADTGNHRIRAVDHGGIVVNVAGDGAEGFAGDGGPATRARLSSPSAIAFADGVLYIADNGNARVRAVAPSGTITTVAGPEQGLVRPTALAVHPDGTLYIGDSGAHRIYKLVR